MANKNGSKKKVLFTIQWYPSVFSANALCDENIIKALVETDEYDITCLVYSTPDISKYETLNGVKVYRFKKGNLWDAVIKAKKDPTKKFSKFILLINRLFQRIKQLLLIPIYPIFEPVAVCKFARKAVRLHQKEKYDIVISEHNGLDSLLAGYYLKKEDPNIKYVPIFWDPLYGKEPAKYLPTQYSKSKQFKLERKIIDYADKAVFMESMRAFHKNNGINYGDKGCYLSFPKLVKPIQALSQDDYTIAGKINIVYSGILNVPDRDPSAFLSILSESSFANEINLIFFCTGAGRNIIEDFKKKFVGNVIISSYIPLSVLKTVYQNADILLNIGGPNPTMIPSKIYDYMSSCKPIVSTYYIDDDSSKPILENYPAALFLDLRKDVNENKMKFDFFIQYLNELNICFDNVESQFILNSPKCYLEMLKKLEE